MKSKIRVLKDHTINKIAAGEVIENPASVVKELVENAIDAEAKEICVEIKGGGRQLIRVSDDGCGMSPDDALLCFERHATSKIRDVEDIHTIMTMGFRGEAIPSIASISKFMLITCPQPDNFATLKNNNSGTMVIVDGGKIISCSPAIRTPGTTIEVKSLFFNVPVRRKFLKSPSFDANEILKTLSLIALGYPNVKFLLINDGKSMLSTSLEDGKPFKDLLNSRVENVLGYDYLQNTIPIFRESNGMSIQGLIGLPNFTRHNRTGQFLFINNRGVFSPLVAYAVKDGYGSSLQSGRHPVYILHLSIEGSLVDVNVHPQKREVRLRQEQQLKDLVIKGIEDALQNNPYQFQQNTQTPTISPVFARALASPEPISLPKSDDWIFQPKSFRSPIDRPASSPHLPSPMHLPPNPHGSSTSIPLPQPSYFSSKPAPHLSSTLSAQLDLTIPKANTPPRVIATIPNYILLDTASDNDFFSKAPLKSSSASRGLLLIDQKAAHSRIIFEKLIQSQQNNASSQFLLIPLTLELSSFDIEALKESMENLNSMGFHIREFGSNTYLVDAIPQPFADSDLKLLMSDILNELKEIHGEKFLQDDKNKKIAAAATRSAVSQHKRLSNDEAQSIINQLCQCQLPYQCPQGKPTFIQLSPEELAKHFQKF